MKNKLTFIEKSVYILLIAFLSSCSFGQGDTLQESELSDSAEEVGVVDTLFEPAEDGTTETTTIESNIEFNN